MFEWNVSPEAFHLGPLTVRWYGLFFAVLFLIGYFVVAWEYKSEGKPVRNLENLLIYIVAGTIIGARLGHVLFYEPGYYLRNPLQVFAVWRGGLASHGGTTGVILALYLYSRRNPGEPFLWLIDRVSVPTALAAAFIRLGNFFNSEILGLPTALPWAVVFTRIDNIPRHPVQLYEIAAYLLVFVVLLTLYYCLRSATPRGLLTGIFLVGVFTSRFFIEFFKERQAAYEQGFAISVGQWLSLPFILAGLFLILRTRKPASRG